MNVLMNIILVQRNRNSKRPLLKNSKIYIAKIRNLGLYSHMKKKKQIKLLIISLKVTHISKILKEEIEIIILRIQL